MRQRFLCLAILIATCQATIAQEKLTREQKVRADKAKVEAEGFWIYNDLDRAYAVARETGKPLLVTLRCLPCEECVKLDDDLVDNDPVIRPLLEQFVCVRIVGTNGLDLDTFQYDTDQSFAVFMLNADKTIYGRFGTRSHRTDWIGDVSLKGMAAALEGALALHKQYPGNKDALAGKRGKPLEFSSPEKYPTLSNKYTSRLNYAGDVVKSCIHCHQIGDARRDYYWQESKAIPEELLFPYPHPKAIGLILDPDQRAVVKSVTSGTPAAEAGLRAGDEIRTMNDQPLLSMADVQWVLHNVPVAGGVVNLQVIRNGETLNKQLDLKPGWRRADEPAWRVASWGLSRIALGGMRLESLDAQERSKLGIDGEMALNVKHVGQYNEHATAKKAGFQVGDILIAFDGQTDLRREADVFAHVARITSRVTRSTSSFCATAKSAAYLFQYRNDLMLSKHRTRCAFQTWIPLLVVLGWATCVPLLAASELPHVVVILVDDMGYGDPQCYNPQSQIKTPNIDAVASAGMRFTDAHAAGPLCHMSRYGLLTGVYPFRTNVGLWPKQPLIEASQTTLASLLRQQGYRTAMVGKWHLGFAESGYDQPLPGGPVDRGFDSFFGIRASTDIPPYFYIRGDQAVEPPTLPIAAGSSPVWSPIQGAFWRAGLIAPDMQLSEVLPKFTDEAIHVIEEHPKDPEHPLFLYLAFPAPHTPWLPSQEFAGKSRAGMYGDFTQMVDAMIGRVLDALDEAKMSEKTLLLVTSDNGPTWYEQDVEKFSHDASGGWRGMKADAWEAGHRVPFIIRWPGNVPPGSTSDQLLGFTDLLATLAAVTNARLPEGSGRDSLDFSSAFRPGSVASAPMRQSLALQSGNGMMTFRHENWKLIEGLGSGGFSKPSKIKPDPGGPQVQLYDLAEDPGETRNLATSHPQQVRRLMDLLDAVR